MICEMAFMWEKSSSIKYKEGELRSRSMPHVRPFAVAVAWAAINYFCILAAVTSLVIFFIVPTRSAMQVFVISLVASSATWLIAFLKRRKAHCPLCKGTPLFNTGAFTHQKAFRLFPFNHGLTAIFSIIFTQRFRCMYCGSRYDMLKKPSYALPVAGGNELE